MSSMYSMSSSSSSPPLTKQQQDSIRKYEEYEAKLKLKTQNNSSFNSTSSTSTSKYITRAPDPEVDDVTNRFGRKGFSVSESNRTIKTQNNNNNNNNYNSNNLRKTQSNTIQGGAATPENVSQWLSMIRVPCFGYDKDNSKVALDNATTSGHGHKHYVVGKIDQKHPIAVDEEQLDVREKLLDIKAKLEAEVKNQQKLETREKLIKVKHIIEAEMEKRKRKKAIIALYEAQSRDKTGLKFSDFKPKQQEKIIADIEKQNEYEMKNGYPDAIKSQINLTEQIQAAE